MTGKLTIIPTPIGNLEDITLRAITVLKEVDVLLCEDTRHSVKLLNYLQINKPLVAFHQHNEHQILPKIIAQLQEGKHIGLVSDAGTPGISDPGFLLSRACVENDIEISCLPGATAFVPALVCSGLPCNNFYFEGFLPHKKGRKTRLDFLLTLDCTVVLYESPYRILKLLQELTNVLPPNAQVVVSREISKIHETHHRGSAKELLDYFTAKPAKGEIVVVFKKDFKIKPEVEE